MTLHNDHSLPQNEDSSIKDDVYEALLMIVTRVGNPAPKQWLDNWLQTPHSRLDGKRPIDCPASRREYLHLMAIVSVEADPDF
jgi:hypothetical protein